MAKKIQENGDFTFPANLNVAAGLNVTGNLSVTGNCGNIRIPLGQSITFEGPDGKATLLFFNKEIGGLEITQMGGASKLRLYVAEGGGFDIGANTLTTAGSDELQLNNKLQLNNELQLNNDILTTGKVVADGSVDTKDFRLINDDKTYLGGLYHLNGSTYISSEYGGLEAKSHSGKIFFEPSQKQ